ncbi:helix-turn-helix domain-containing protein [Clostridium senegalense]
MEFLTGAEKIKELRKKLKMTQQDFATENFTRGYLGLLENSRRNITKEAAKTITNSFIKRAKELNINLEIDEEYFLRTPKEEAQWYCDSELKKENITIEELKDILEIGRVYGLDKIKCLSYMRMGEIYFKNSEYVNAYKYYFFALDLNRNDLLADKEITLYNRIAKCKYYVLNYDEAIVLFMREYESCKKFNKRSDMQKALYNLAVCYKQSGDIDKTILTLNKFTENYEFYDDKEEELYICANSIKANCYKDKGQCKTAIDIYNNLISKMNFKNDILAYVYNNIGDAYLGDKDLETALDYFNKSQQIRIKEDKPNLSHTLVNKAKVYLEKKLYEECIMILELSLENAMEYKDYEYIVKTYNLFEKAYLQTKDYRKLEFNYKKMIEILDKTKNYLDIIKVYTKLQELYLNNNEIEKANDTLKKIQCVLLKVKEIEKSR